MGVSDAYNIPFVVSELQRLQPASILDVGVGFGKWGVLAREYLECWNERNTPDTWKVRLEGIEVFEGYHTPLWDCIYDRVHIGDVREIVPHLQPFELALCCDVIEHMPKEEGQRLLQQLTEICKTVVLTTPISFWEQQASGNVYEQHMSLWGEQDLAGYSGRLVQLGATFAGVISKKKPGSPPPKMQHRLDHVGARLLARALFRRVWLKLQHQAPK